MRLKILGLALAALTLAVLTAGAAMAEDDSDSSDAQFRNAKIINTVSPPRRATYPRAPRTRGRALLPPPVFASQNAISNEASPAEIAPPIASAPAAPSQVLRGRRIPSSPAGRLRPLPKTPPAAQHPAVLNAPVAARDAAALANSPVPAVANATAGLANEASPEAMPAMEVSVKGGLASVKIVNTPMSAVLNALAKEGGFTVKLYGNTPDLPVSTEFSGMELQRAAIRIMALAGIKNYFFHYDDKGALTMLETFETAGGVKALPNTPVRRPVNMRVSRPQMPIPGAERRRPARAVRPPISEEPAYNDQFDNEDNSSDNDPDSDSEEPAYTPPTPRRR